jgi:hypothetical protein
VSQKNGKLTILPTAESPIPFDNVGPNKFKSEQNELTVEFTPGENKFVFNNGTQQFEFTRE